MTKLRYTSTYTDAQNEAANLIDRSYNRGEIAHATYTPDVADVLREECDDCVDGNATIEYWGTSDDGTEWRVHLRRVSDSAGG